MKRVLISAGDASGQRIALDVVHAMRRRRPDLEVAGLLGAEAAASGVSPVADPRALAVGGIVELVPSAFRIVGTWRKMVAALDRALAQHHEPDAAPLEEHLGVDLAVSAAQAEVG